MKMTWNIEIGFAMCVSRWKFCWKYLTHIVTLYNIENIGQNMNNFARTNDIYF